MKKVQIVILFLMMLSFLLCFVGCKEVVSQTENYTIERIDGTCYLTFSDGFEPRARSPYESFRPLNVLFSSVDEMFHTLTNGMLDDGDLQVIYSLFATDNGYYRIVDPYNVNIPVLPEGRIFTTVSVSSGGSYSFSVKNLTGEHDGGFDVITEEYYEKRVSDLRERFAETFEKSHPHQTVSYVGVESERNATVYESKNESLEYRHKIYSLSEGNKTIYVHETYRLMDKNSDARNSSTVPSLICLYGSDNGVFFYCHTSQWTERPTEEWLLSFGVTLYEPPESAISEK